MPIVRFDAHAYPPRATIAKLQEDAFRRGAEPARDAIIPADKLRDYLLSTIHPDGRGKAEYLGRLGYSQDAFGRLDADLREQVLSLEAQPGRASRYGEKYEILGSLTGPNGNTAWVRTIWIILTGETAPRLVTLIPAEKP